MNRGGDRGRGFDRGRGGPRGGGARGGSPSGRGSPAGDGGRGRGRGGPPGEGFRGRGGPPGEGFRGRGGFQGDRGRGGPPGDRGRGAPRGGRGGGGFGREQGGVFALGQPANLDARLTDSSQDQLVASLKALTLRHDDLPTRPDYGTAGVQIKLRANFFPVRVPKAPLHEYDVSITPSTNTAVKRVRRRIFELAERTPEWASKGLRGNVAHDWAAKLIAAKPLEQPLTIKILLTDDDDEVVTDDTKEYILTIKYIQPIETGNLLKYLEGNPQHRNFDITPVVAALNLVLSSHASHGGINVGKNRFFFPSAMPPVSIGGGLEAWKGFYSSVRPSFKQLMVNVNVCTTAFYSEGNLADGMFTFQNASFGARMSAFVKGVRVRTEHLGYKKTVKQLSKFTAKTYRFDCEELGGSVTVLQYFSQKYQINLKYPDLPLVDVGGKKANLLPPELCTILPNQPFRGKLLDEHTAQMILHAAKPPNVNANSITTHGLRELGFKQGTPTPMNAFGIAVGNEMTVVPGRILTPPRIKYGRGEPAVDERASWNLRGVVFADGATLDNWAVLLIKDGNRDEFEDVNDPSLRQTIDGFAKMCKTSGMRIGTKPPTYAMVNLPRKNPQDPIRSQAVGAIRGALLGMKPKPNLVLVILSNGDKHVYSGLKHLCDVYLDVATVCVQSPKIRKEKGQIQYFANVALKVNMKLGGVNHGLDEQSMSKLRAVPTMLVGMDVTHPGPGTVKGTPSIAAVVASADLKFAQYPSSMRIQETKKEMITDLKDMMEERLKLFRDKNSRTLPQRVLVYRDGVSEGQFATVIAEEVPQMREAFRKFDTKDGPYQPQLTVVVCAKRHHTRFYPTEPQHADRDGNPRPGTVVDRGVTSVYDFDFYLQAHGGLQGTTRPTHYYVICNEMNLRADDLQGLTNAVSYTFARATKAVSLVSPAYYADLACERGRCYLHKLLQGLSDSGVTSASGSTAQDDIWREAEKLWHGGVKGKLKDIMYYL